MSLLTMTEIARERLPVRRDLREKLYRDVDGCLGSPVCSIEGIPHRPAWRGKNSSRKPVDFAGQWCRSQRCRTMAANAEVANPGAQTFLARAGFEETYRIVEYRKSLD